MKGILKEDKEFRVNRAYLCISIDGSIEVQNPRYELSMFPYGLNVKSMFAIRTIAIAVVTIAGEKKIKDRDFLHSSNLGMPE